MKSERILVAMMALLGGVLFLVPETVSAQACNGGNPQYIGQCVPTGSCGGFTEVSDAICVFQTCCITGTNGGGGGSGNGGGGGGGGTNQGASCFSENFGWSGICEFSNQCSSNNSDTSANCTGGLICCNTSNPAPITCDSSGGRCDVTCAQNENFGPTNGCSSGEVCCVAGTGGGGTGGGGTGSGGGGTGGGGTGATASGGCPTGYSAVAGVCFPGGTGLSTRSVGEIVLQVLFWLLGIFGFIAVLGFVISGIQYLVSAGNEDMIETAKRNMKYSIVGVIVALSGWIVIQAIDRALNGTTTIF